MPIANDNSFAAACYNDNTIEELREASDAKADASDMEAWGLTEAEWRQQIQEALTAKLEDLEN